MAASDMNTVGGWWEANLPELANSGVSGYGTGGNPAPPVTAPTGNTSDTGFFPTPTGAPPPPVPGAGGSGDPVHDWVMAHEADIRRLNPGATGTGNTPEYYEQRIRENGGFGGAYNQDYWLRRITGGESGANEPAGGSNQFASVGGVPGSTFGAPASPYVSNPNAPTYSAPATPSWLSSPYVAGKFTAPTGTEVLNDPGYAFGLEQGTKQIQRSAAARGTVLNPGTVGALERYGTDYATTKYGDVVNRNAGIFGMNEGNQFAARQQNQNEFQQNVVNPAQQTFQNQYASYLNDNARTLNDYLMSYSIAHNTSTDFWNNYNKLADRGLSATLGGRPSA